MQMQIWRSVQFVGAVPTSQNFAGVNCYFDTVAEQVVQHADFAQVLVLRVTLQ